MKKIFLTLTILFLTFNAKTIADTSNSIQQIYEGNEDAKVTIITYESLTCGHCADFHKNVYPKLKKEFIDTGLVKIEFRHFPLDMAAFNASKIAQCNNNGKSDLLHFLFSNQKKWVIGETVEEVNENLKKLLKDENIVIDFEKCINNKNIEDYVLNDRIEGVKKFKVNATPTIIINNKKFDKTLNYKNLKKIIEKLI
jgi:protein-disulfide isomerase